MINIANALQTTIQAALPRLRALSEQDAQRDRGEGKWVVKQILGHLIDSAANNHQRFVRARGADPVVFPGYDQNAWVAAHAYTIRSWPELIDIWIAYNAQVAEVISSTPSERRQVQCLIGDNEARDARVADERLRAAHAAPPRADFSAGGQSSGQVIRQ